MKLTLQRNTYTKLNRKNVFTLAELLIIVAIISVLIAICIPVFSAHLEKRREAVDIANVRSAYTEVMTAAIHDDTDNTVKIVKLQQKN